MEESLTARLEEGVALIERELKGPWTRVDKATSDIFMDRLIQIEHQMKGVMMFLKKFYEIGGKMGGMGINAPDQFINEAQSIVDGKDTREEPATRDDFSHFPLSSPKAPCELPVIPVDGVAQALTNADLSVAKP